MAGMDLVPENDQLLVRHVYPGSAAENVGIQTDDRIVSINGRPSNQYSQRGLGELMREEGIQHEICLFDIDTVERCVDIVLKRRV
ncbi:MAG: PDZ domain-containing protein [Pseudomonadota bacterium]